MKILVVFDRGEEITFHRIEEDIEKIRHLHGKYVNTYGLDDDVEVEIVHLQQRLDESNRVDIDNPVAITREEYIFITGFNL